MPLLDKNINELTKEDWEELYHFQGMTLPQLSAHYGLSLRTICNKMDKQGVTRRSTGRRKSISIDVEELISMYVENKMSVVEVAAYFGCSDGVIRRELKRLGCLRVSRPTKNWTKEFLIYELENKSPKELAAKLEVSVPTMYKVLHRAGIKVGSSHRDSLTVENIKSVVEMYTGGSTSTEVAEALCLTNEAVYRALAKSGIEMRSNNSYIRKIPTDKVVAERYIEGESVGKLADQFGVNKRCIQESLKRSGTEYRSKSESLLGELNPMKGKKHTNATRSKMAQAFVSGVKELPDGPRGNSESLETPHQGTVMTRSSWEAAVGRYFNKIGVDYLYEPDTLTAVLDGRTISYTPDFKLLSDNSYIEVKGHYTDENKRRMKLFLDNTKIKVWWGKELQELGILDKNFKVVL